MPEVDVVHIAIIAAMAVAGAITGWVLRSRRAQEEKAAVSSGWQEQLRAKETEHERLTDQNKGLMEQISQYQASNKDAKNRARELSDAVQEAYARRDELQREIKDIRSNLETSLSERKQLQSDVQAQSYDAELLAARDARIEKLQTELRNWQNRLPPLIEKFRVRNEEALQLESDLAAAHNRVSELEAALEHGQTRIEPVRDPESLTNGRDASNDDEEDEDDGEAVDEDFATDDAQGEDDDGKAETIEDRDDVEGDEDDEDEDDEDDTPIVDERDRLQAIKGVGPAIEKTLNEMGIFTYQQIADMSEYDINRIAKQLKGLRSRIYREDWMGQARELRDQTSDG